VLLHDTIAALATAPAPAGIGVVRLSGPDAHRIARELTGRAEPFELRHATFTRIFDQDGIPLDQVVVTSFQAPHSYTGDDVVEISGHGSPVLLRRIVELAMTRGARLAEPGEFTLRAYLNGRLDLVQAEAVADLVEAVTPLQARAAMDQLEGTLTTAIGAIDRALFDLAAKLEASLDFPDEGFHFVESDEAAHALATIGAELDRLAGDGRAGRVIREGRSVVIAGLPNAGKSSLFNALVGAGRAIVTEIAGTTRDILTERVDLDGLAVTLVDTAGLRDVPERIEAEGVARAREAQGVASLRLLLVDASAPVEAEALALVERLAAPRIVVVTKCDLPRAWDIAKLGDAAADAVEASVVSAPGLGGLRRRIVTALTEREDLRDAPAITNVRHLALVDDARAAVARAMASLEAGATEELVLAELTAARQALESITGRRSADDLLRHIFERFCIGK
jgi:tRNA modification GTPase